MDTMVDMSLDELVERGRKALEKSREEVRLEIVEREAFEVQLRERFVAEVERLFPAVRGYVHWERWVDSHYRHHDSQALIRVPGFAPVRVYLRSQFDAFKDVLNLRKWEIPFGVAPFQVLDYGPGWDDDAGWYVKENGGQDTFDLAVALASAAELGDTYKAAVTLVEQKKSLDLVKAAQPVYVADDEPVLEVRLLECLVELVDVVVSERLKNRDVAVS